MKTHDLKTKVSQLESVPLVSGLFSQTLIGLSWHTEKVRLSDRIQNLGSYWWGAKKIPKESRSLLRSLHATNTSPIFSRQASTQVLAVLSDAQPGAVKNNNMSEKLTTAQTTENGTRLRVEKHFKISRSALEFIKCQDPCLLLRIKGQREKEKGERKKTLRHDFRDDLALLVS